MKKFSLSFLLAASVLSSVAYAAEDPCEDSNVLSLQIYDEINSSTAFAVGSFIQRVNEIKDFRAVLLDIDSPGGAPASADDIAHSLRASKKPVIALVRDTGTSAAYWVATGAAEIIADPVSMVGSIGVIFEIPIFEEKYKKEGIDVLVVTSGSMKGAVSSNRKPSPEAKALLERMAHETHEYFIQEVARNRNLPVESVRAVADGAPMLGIKAKELGLVDHLGTYSTALDLLRKKLNDVPHLCVMRMP